MDSNNQSAKNSFHPVVRLRYIVIGVICVCLLVAGPLFSVWKQVYIRNSSIRKEALADSLVFCSKESERLKLSIEKLSQRSRIEQIAFVRLRLVYPLSEQIVVVRISQPKKETLGDRWKFFAVLKRSFAQGKG